MRTNKLNPPTVPPTENYFLLSSVQSKFSNHGIIQFLSEG